MSSNLMEKRDRGKGKIERGLYLLFLFSVSELVGFAIRNRPWAPP